MNHLTVNPATLTSIARTYSAVADEIGSVASRLDADGVTLTAVFGVIGTDFVGTVQSSTRRYRERMVGLADEARSIADRLDNAGTAYRGTDDAAEAAIAAATGSAPRRRVA